MLFQMETLRLKGMLESMWYIRLKYLTGNFTMNLAIFTNLKITGFYMIVLGCMLLIRKIYLTVHHGVGVTGWGGFGLGVTILITFMLMSLRNG